MLKEHGVYNQARCRVRGFDLHEEDAERLRDNHDTEVILKHLPKKIFVEMQLKHFPQYEGLPKHWVPIPVASTIWYLDKEKAIPISRKGFAVVPDFSSTIHSATGRTLNRVYLI